MINWVEERTNPEWDPERQVLHIPDQSHPLFHFFLKDVLLRKTASRLARYGVDFGFYPGKNPEVSFKLKTVAAGFSQTLSFGRSERMEFVDKDVIWEVTFCPTEKQGGWRLCPLGKSKRIPIPRKPSDRFRDAVHLAIHKHIVPDLNSPYNGLRESNRKDFERVWLMLNYCVYNRLPEFIISAAYREMPVHHVMST